MSTKIRGRNMDGIRHEALRKKVDELFYDLHDELTDAYYNHWRHGDSFTWHGIDLSQRGNPKRAFDILHGLVYKLYAIVFYEVNQLDPDGGIPEEEFNVHRRDPETGAIIEWKHENARQWISANLNAAQTQWLRDNVRPRIKQWVKNRLGHDISGE